MTRPPRPPSPLPMRDGVSPSCVVVPGRPPALLIDFLAERFPMVQRNDWLTRLARGDVRNDAGERLSAHSGLRPQMRLHYYRELAHEQPVPFEARVLFRDKWLVVADKPHFLPVAPSGRFVRETLLTRLKQQLGLEQLSPIHRIDRETAGLVVFAIQPATRGAYQALFRDQQVHKHYEAIARWRSDLVFPLRRSSRIAPASEFFRQQEVPGAPNAVTDMVLVATQGPWARYRLEPLSGKTHQLRVHMAALGLPLWGDRFYPEVLQGPHEADEYTRPLKLLARSLAFTDPVTGQARQFASQRTLDWPEPDVTDPAA